MQLRWTAPLIIGAALLVLIPTADASWRPLKGSGGAASTLGGAPLCLVSLSRTVPTKPVRAGGKLSTRVKIVNTGASLLNALTVQVGLPSNVCAYKTGKRY